MPGLGVAIGVNLTPSFCGLFGPNRNYTSFSTGMNQTARLQSLGTFRETLVMDSAMKAINTSKDPALAGLKFGPLVETLKWRDPAYLPQRPRLPESRRTCSSPSRAGPSHPSPSRSASHTPMTRGRWQS